MDASSCRGDMSNSAMNETKWFRARLVFESMIGDGGNSDPLCEDRVVLFQATDSEAARHQAARYGTAGGGSYNNQFGEPVAWRLLRIDDIEDVGEPDGAGWEIASRHFRRSDTTHEEAS